MNKKMTFAAFLLACGLVTSACGTDEAAAPKEEEQETVEQQEEPKPAEQEQEAVETEKEEPKEEVKEEPKEEEPKPAQGGQKQETAVTQKPTEQKKPTTVKPVEKTASKPSTDAQSNANNASKPSDKKPENKVPAYTFSADSVLSKVKAAYGDNYLPNIALDAAAVEATFKLNLSLVEEFVGEVPMIGFHPDKVLIIKAKDGNIKKVVAQLEAARKDIVENSLNYPANAEKIKSAKVVQKDNYAAFFMVGSANNMSDDPEERLQFAEAEVQKAVNAFYAMFK